MRTGIVAGGWVVAASFACVIAAEPMLKSNVPSANVILKQVVNREKNLNRVTGQPYSIDQRLAMMRAAPSPTETPDVNPHRGHAIHVYVSPQGELAMRSGKEMYPAGTLIVKEKFPSPLDAKPANAAPKLQTELFTAMLKHAHGYDPDHGDWEYFVISGDAKQVLARGKLDSCIQCHIDHKATDYVIRAYMK